VLDLTISWLHVTLLHLLKALEDPLDLALLFNGQLSISRGAALSKSPSLVDVIEPFDSFGRLFSAESEGIQDFHY